MATPTKIIENVSLFKDFNFRNEWKEPWTKQQYDVHFYGKKAKVVCRTPFASEPEISRLVKLSNVGSWTGGDKPNRYGYQLTVNGHQAFFICEHNIHE